MGTQRRTHRSADEVTATVDVTIAGTASAAIPLALAIDAALADEAFRRWLDSQPPRALSDLGAMYWPNDKGQYPKAARYRSATRGAIDITVFSEKGVAIVTLDAVTLKVLGRKILGS